jgi:hypothetical protein
MPDLSGVHRLAQDETFGRFTVFLFESPNSSDLGGANREADLLKAACELSGHRFASYAPVSLRALGELLRYVFETWKPKEGQEHKPQFSLHFSSHGNDDGVQVGREFVRWKALFTLLGKTQGKSEHPFIVSMSACGGERLALTHHKHKGRRPLYVFSFMSKVFWPEAALAWALVYRKVSTIRVGDRKAVSQMVDDIRRLQLGDLRYHRWVGDRYRIYPARGGE